LALHTSNLCIDTRCYGSHNGYDASEKLDGKTQGGSTGVGFFFLSRKDTSSLFMIGIGALSANLVRAHASVRPIKNVFV
jgi:hypothetical protein